MQLEQDDFQTPHFHLLHTSYKVDNKTLSVACLPSEYVFVIMFK